VTASLTPKNRTIALETAQRLATARGGADLAGIPPAERTAFVAEVSRALPSVPAAEVREVLREAWVTAAEAERADRQAKVPGLLGDGVPASLGAIATQGRPAGQLCPMAAARFGVPVPAAARAATEGDAQALKKGFEWMPASVPAVAGLATVTARTAGALTAEDVKRGVLHGVIPDSEIAAVDDPNLVRFTLPKAQANVVTTQVRDTNGVLFSPMAFDVAARMRRFRGGAVDDILRDAPGIGAHIKALPHVTKTDLPIAEVPDHVAHDAAHLGVDPAPYLEKANKVADSGTSIDNCMLSGSSEAIWRAPVGDYGEELSMALVDAARVVMREAKAVIDTTADSPAYREINPKLAIAGDLAGTWEQAIEAMCGAVALLTSKQVGDKSADEVLASLSDGGALLQLAARGTFYTLEPLVTVGYLSKDPLQIDDNGKARLPRGVLEYVREIRNIREDFSADATSDYAKAHMQAGAPHSTETKRGCPLAQKVPIYDENGKLQMPDHTALETLGTEYVELVRHFLRERQKSAAA
jgi:hypothetical protein